MTRALGLAVVEAVADAEDVDPTDLDPPLGDVIDPDALESIFRDSNGELTFTYHGHRVTVEPAGTVDLEPTDGR